MRTAVVDVGGGLRGGHEAPATGWKRLRKRP